MKRIWSFDSQRRLAINSGWALLLMIAAHAGAIPRATAGVPDWLRAAARAPVPKYSDETNAVMLLNERAAVVGDDGEIKTVVRRAYRILRPQGRDVARVVVHFDQETRLTFLKGWSLTAQGFEYESKEKDAVETSASADLLYDDTRLKILSLPGADTGSVVGYEYEQRHRPYVLQDFWWFQDDIPVLQARFQLRLPKGWEFKEAWLNFHGPAARPTGENRWAWELNNVPAVETEPEMPPWRAVAGRLALTFYPRESSQNGKSHGSWEDVARWYAQLASARRQPTPKLKQKVAELTAPIESPLGKVKALAAFAQREIRYVAIEIGIGGYQPHSAGQVFANRYGDCKDKVTLLSTMLREIGIESEYVLVHTSRGVIAPDFPSALNFNHVILAIRLPEEIPKGNLHTTVEDERAGRWLYFDPTDHLTPLGYLPPTLQANYGLLVTGEGGRLVQFPLLPPSTNRLLRQGKLTLNSTGILGGSIVEIRWGSPAISRRAALLDATETERMKQLESFLAGFVGGARITGTKVQNLEKYDEGLVLNYSFVAENYAQRAGELLLLRPRIVGQKSWNLLERKERKYPVEFDDTSLETDIFEITLPPEYKVEELPPPLELEYPFGTYKSKIEISEDVLKYTRQYQIRQIQVPVDQLPALKEFFRRISDDERASVVLRRAAAPTEPKQ